MKIRLVITFCYIFYFSTISNAQDSSKILLQQITDSINEKSPEKPILNIINQYYSLNGNVQQKDSLYKIVQTLYPHGKVAAHFYLLNTLLEKTRPEEKMTLKAFLGLSERFPNVDINKESSSLYKMYDQIRYLYFGSFIEEDSTLTMQKVYPTLKTSSNLNSVAWYLSSNPKHLELSEWIAEEALKKGLEELSDSVKVPKKNLESWKASQILNYAYTLETYAEILAKEGKMTIALDKVKQAVDLTKEGDAMLNNSYINILISNKENAEATKFGEKVYLSGKGNAGTAKLLDSLYVMQHPGTKSDTYLKQLAKQSLEKQVLNIDAPSFSLKDLNGNLVHSSDLKGKIIVLDFWATWCGPCKASFPGMQLAVNKYKGNKNIMFLFVDTFERFDDPNQRNRAVAAVVKSMKLDFEVLLDKQDNSAFGGYELAGKLKIPSIPTKFIIGKDGKIKFKLVGFAGSDQAVLHEMDDVINYLL